MLSAYLGSVIVYMLIMSSTAMICEINIRNNGWLDDSRKNKQSKKLAVLFSMAAVPIFRVFVVGMIFVMAVYPKEKVMAWIEEHKNLNS